MSQVEGGDREWGSGTSRGTSAAPQTQPPRGPRWQHGQQEGRTDGQVRLPQREAGKGTARGCAREGSAPRADPAPLWTLTVAAPHVSPQEPVRAPGTAHLCGVTPHTHCPPPTTAPPKAVRGSSPPSATPGLGQAPPTLQPPAPGRAAGWHVAPRGQPHPSAHPRPRSGRAPHPDCPMAGPEQPPCEGAAEGQQLSGTSLVPLPRAGHGAQLLAGKD